MYLKSKNLTAHQFTFFKSAAKAAPNLSAQESSDNSKSSSGTATKWSTPYSRPGLFFKPSKAELLERLLQYALLVDPRLRDSILELIVNLIKDNKNLANYVSKDLKCNPIELAHRLNDTKTIAALEKLGCRIRPEREHQFNRIHHLNRAPELTFSKVDQANREPNKKPALYLVR